jgi:hypothetical protein
LWEWQKDNSGKPDPLPLRGKGERPNIVKSERGNEAYFSYVEPKLIFIEN